ncbi:hypothetical protein [Oligoflexus tunisiensis]|uniref:hypothetical protein n=1 Tax=Oligoflexus tunisiensis TaxID=708132 RepID=UPI000AC3F359|nr:hypothetical protein [Oligoflexus tunisiensis]
MQMIHPTIFRVCQVGAAFCFIGHGAFGIMAKQDWCPFFGTVGISEGMALQLMPWIGVMDISLGILALLRPMPITFLFMTFWALWTAMCRPLAGFGWWEFLERAGNYGPPFALLLLSNWGFDRHKLFSRLMPDTNHRFSKAIFVLRMSTALLLIGHGGFGAFMQKKMLLQHWQAVGVSLDPQSFMMLGWFEIILGFAALGWSSPLIFLGIFIWKICTELLYPLSGAPMWEFIERAGSYACPLALLIYFRMRPPRKAMTVQL